MEEGNQRIIGFKWFDKAFIEEEGFSLGAPTLHRSRQFRDAGMQKGINSSYCIETPYVPR